ncbi:hypothetical protein EGR_05899 [Echinococcus granulosus]|uniref:Uncharacterized protein n=1 Tax=Echinococcus granulosus TaxID=6210 RepID=W6UE69_ECHGR|nr:hypothetical protein EGR_05899 [Echinococcus granulosus]EUB59171.1 hypothetical protein EGR_05899 [Echinococcus granulosus]
MPHLSRHRFQQPARLTTPKAQGEGANEGMKQRIAIHEAPPHQNHMTCEHSHLAETSTKLRSHGRIHTDANHLLSPLRPSFVPPTPQIKTRMHGEMAREGIGTEAVINANVSQIRPHSSLYRPILGGMEG